MALAVILCVTYYEHIHPYNKLKWLRAVTDAEVKSVLEITRWSLSLRCMKNLHPHDAGAIKECQHGTDGPNWSHISIYILLLCALAHANEADVVIMPVLYHVYICFYVSAYLHMRPLNSSMTLRLSPAVNVTLKGWALSVSGVFIVYARNSADVKDPLKSKWETCL